MSARQHRGQIRPATIVLEIFVRLVDEYESFFCPWLRIPIGMVAHCELPIGPFDIGQLRIRR